MNVAVRGDDGDLRGVLDAVGATPVAEDGDRRIDAVLVADEAGLRSVAADPPSAPVLLVTEGGARDAVDPSTLGDALAAGDAGEWRVDPHPVLRVRRDGTVVGQVLREVVLVTAAPASISEYAVAGDGAGTSVRADGLVVATPVGSDGYAAAAGGPTLDATTGVVVVPVAPFSTSADATVVDPDTGLALSVVREGKVALFLDGVRHGSVGAGADLRIDRVGSVPLVSTRTENF